MSDITEITKVELAANEASQKAADASQKAADADKNKGEGK